MKSTHSATLTVEQAQEMGAENFLCRSDWDTYYCLS